MGRSLSDRPIR